MRVLAAAVVIAACYSPHIQTGNPCANGPCPSGLVCSPATSTCELVAEPVDARASDATVDDASVDARAIDAPIAIDARADAPGPTIPVLVQQITGHNLDGPMVSVTLPNSPVAGHVLVMVGGNPSGPLSGVTGAAATWTPITRATANSNIEIWVAVADGSGATVTSARQGADSPNTAWVGEWSGLVGGPVVDGHQSSSGSTVGQADPGPAVTSAARDLVIFGVDDGSPNTFGTPTPGVWIAATPITATTNNQSVWYAIANGAGMVEPTVSETSGFWDAAIVTLQIAP